MNVTDVTNQTLFYIHTLYSVVHRTIYIIYKLSLVAFCYFGIFPP
nr:MAG TPA: hypothetical protein [Caudoviricetes sp.]